MGSIAISECMALFPAPDCPECGDNSDVERSDDGFYCSYEECEIHFEEQLPNCPYCESSEHVQEHEAEEVVEALLAIEAAIDPKEAVSNRINKFIQEESDFFGKNSTHNPWENVNQRHWYEAKRIGFGVNTQESIEPISYHGCSH